MSALFHLPQPATGDPVCAECGRLLDVTGLDGSTNTWVHRPESKPEPHEHYWQPAGLRQWMTLPSLRIAALCTCGEVRWFGVPE